MVKNIPICMIAQLYFYFSTWKLLFIRHILSEQEEKAQTALGPPLCWSAHALLFLLTCKTEFYFRIEFSGSSRPVYLQILSIWSLYYPFILSSFSHLKVSTFADLIIFVYKINIGISVSDSKSLCACAYSLRW